MTVLCMLFDETECNLLCMLSRAAMLQFKCNWLHVELAEVNSHLASADAKIVWMEALCMHAHAEAADSSTVLLKSSWGRL